MIITRATDDQCQKTALFHPKTLFQGEVFHNLFIFLMNITHFYSFNNSFNFVVKNIHSKNLFIQQKKQIIHSKNLFIQNNPELFIKRKYSFKWKMDYRPGLAPTEAPLVVMHHSSSAERVHFLPCVKSFWLAVEQSTQLTPLTLVIVTVIVITNKTHRVSKRTHVPRRPCQLWKHWKLNQNRLNQTYQSQPLLLVQLKYFCVL